jgi:poly-gamma-glutamate capsule biosynthesis protein CapA/YwtB (metallophosphatase superfamily)
MRHVSHRVRAVALAGITLAVATAVFGQAGRTSAPAPDGRFTLALTGDSIITRRLSVYREPEFLKLIELLRSADAAFTNLEVLFHDYESYPMHQSGGTYMRAEPALADELVWAGFDLVSRANNHAGDYGVLGMQLTSKYVRQAGLVEAGVGNSLAEAREARFLETPDGRVALVSVASTFPDHARAGRSRGDVPPRPGLNPLRFRTTYVVTRERLETLRSLLKELGLNAPAQGEELSLLGHRFLVGERPAVRTEPLEDDVREIAAVVNNASRLADYTLVSIHAHEGRRDLFEPAEFLVAFAHRMIEAGADVFVGHGPHVLRGIEIYKGKPIFYSLGDFIFQNETLLRLPSENYEPYGLGPEAHVADFNDRRYDHDRRGFPAQREVWESVVAVPVWQGKALVELTLYPISLGFGKPRQVRGRPVLADPALARKIIEDVARLSKPFGTVIEWREGVGRVVLPPTSSQ